MTGGMSMGVRYLGTDTGSSVPPGICQTALATRLSRERAYRVSPRQKKTVPTPSAAPALRKARRFIMDGFLLFPGYGTKKRTATTCTCASDRLNTLLFQPCRSCQSRSRAAQADQHKRQRGHLSTDSTSTISLKNTDYRHAENGWLAGSESGPGQFAYPSAGRCI